LSLGERQRLALTRAWLGTPRLLLLDDLDSIADPLLRAQLRSAIGSYRGTIVMVTQQADLLALADCAWRLAAGELTRTRPLPRADDPLVRKAQAVTREADAS
jgi:ATP-binding cassette subfamily C protein CydD